MIKFPLMLALDAGGTSTRWITYKDAAYYLSKDLVAWALGKHEYVLHGGYNRDGVQSTLTMNTIFAIKGHVQEQHISRNGKFRPPMDNPPLFERDNHICGYCLNKFKFKYLTRDHIIPKRFGGPNTWGNCVTACKRCNHHKADKMPSSSGMKLKIKVYVPCKNEHLILTNPKLLKDQLDYLVSKIENKDSRFYNNNE